jgi:biopolymer transport protein ExbD
MQQPTTNSEGKHSAEPNVTPLIDVLLVLLITFMAAIPAQGAPQATYQEVITALDIARGAGVTVVGIDTRRQ